MTCEQGSSSSDGGKYHIRKTEGKPYDGLTGFQRSWDNQPTEYTEGKDIVVNGAGKCECLSQGIAALAGVMKVRHETWMPVIIRKGEALEAEHLIDKLREIIPGVVPELHAVRMNADGGGAISILLSSPEKMTTDQQVAVCKLVQSCVIKPAKETQGAD